MFFGGLGFCCGSSRPCFCFVVEYMNMNHIR
jgi:hypothetical protein